MPVLVLCITGVIAAFAIMFVRAHLQHVQQGLKDTFSRSKERPQDARETPVLLHCSTYSDTPGSATPQQPAANRVVPEDKDKQKAE
jgi:hypothetical protein